ncbi:MAG: hypothetical protein WCF67_22690 [Chitinophagaceae bacterium]
MSTKHCLLLFICIVFYQLLPAQDGKLSWYYPKLGEADGRTGKNSSYILNTQGTHGCVSGNCKSGNGEYLIAYPANDSLIPSMAINPVIRLTIFKGQFSNDGKNFEGTVYSRKVYYDVVYKKDHPKLIPKVKENLKDDAFWKGYEVASGSMEKTGSINYAWHGWMEPARNAATPVAPGQPTTFRAHFNSDIAYVDISYAPGGAYTSVKGRSLQSGDLIGGRIHFSDGTRYEGFLQNGKRIGPGRYTSKDDKTEEGIWMLDSLAMPMAVSLPAALFEPEKEAVPTIAQMAFGPYPPLEFKDAGQGWVYSFYANTLFLGKMESGKLTGPGFWFNVEEPGHTYRTGIFREGKLFSGMKVTDNVSAVNKEGTAMSVQYRRNYTDVITGEFKDYQLKPSCAKMIRYNAKGNPILLLEGYFYPGQFKKEFADGWVYVNDWEGKRDPANLRYMYSGENYLTMNGNATYVSWFTKGLKESETATYCLPSMKNQSAPILALMKHRHDSVMVLATKREADIAANKAAFKKRAEDCAKEGAKYSYQSGDLYQDGEGYHPVKILIAGPFDCYTKSYQVFVQSWKQITNTTGYLNTAITNMSVEKFKGLKKIGSSQGVCGSCFGRGTVPKTLYTAVGGNSGYTSVGGGWMVKNPETYWKTEAMVICTECSGVGFGKQ